MNSLKLVYSNFRSQLIFILTPLVFLPLVLVSSTPQSTCLYVVAVMSVYWLFEVMPLAVTALLPVFMYPMGGILSANAVAEKYMPDVNFLSIGGLIVALAVEKCNLHQRLALRVLTMVGSEPKWILFGFMCITSFLSMWMSNTACTAMMVPIAMSVIEEWQKSNVSETESDSAELISKDATKRSRSGSIRSDKSIPVDVSKVVIHAPSDKTLNTQQLAVAKSLLLGIAYAAGIGGTATLTGSPTNISMVGLMKSLFPQDGGRSVTYVLYLLFAFPVMIVTLVLSWISLQCYFLGFKLTMLSLIPVRLRRSTTSRDSTTTSTAGVNTTELAKRDKVKQMFMDRYRKLPKMSFAETSVLCIFTLLVVMWVLRDLGVPGFSGFGILFKKGYFSDATSAVLISVLLFIFPSENPLTALKSEKTGSKKNIDTLMDWGTMKRKFPWDVIFLLGGGFALAAGVKTSGLSTSIGNILGQMNTVPLGVLQIICVIIAILLTNIASNVVTCSILVPIVSGMAQKLEINPLAVILPVTLGCSYAYMLPVGTPPNAIVFGPGILKLKDMIGAGFYVSIISAICVVIHCQTLARAYINLDTYPQWANATAIALLEAGVNATVARH